jgi:hypothetical protein
VRELVSLVRRGHHAWNDVALVTLEGVRVAALDPAAEHLIRPDPLLEQALDIPGLVCR